MCGFTGALRTASAASHIFWRGADCWAVINLCAKFLLVCRSDQSHTDLKNQPVAMEDMR